MILFNVALIAAQPVNAAVVVDDVVLLVIASVCLGLAMNIAITNPNWGNTFSGVYDSLSTTCKTYVNEAAESIGNGYTMVYNWQVDRYEALTDEIIAYFHENSFQEVPGTITPSNPSGKIGFTSDSSFTLLYPRNTNSCSYVLPSGTFTIYDVYNKNAFPACAARDAATFPTRGYIITNSDGFGFCEAIYNSYSWSDCTFTPYLYTRNNARESDYLRPSNNSSSVFNLSSTSVPITSSYNFSYYFDSLGNIYRIYSPDNITYSFRDINSGTDYQNLSFPSRLALVDWFRNSLGLVTLTYGSSVESYSAPITDTGVTFDEETAVAAQSTNVSNAQATGSISTVIPGTAADLGTLADSPGAVLNPSVAQTIVAVYPSDVPQIDKSPNLWLQKFPFCVPFDFARILSDLKAPPEAPELSFIILPENFFELGNEAYYVDIDFSMFSQFIAILRFFISLGFVLFLIILTRDIIKG